MLKRIISGVLASVLLFLSIPTVSFAEDTVNDAQCFIYTAEWLTRLYNAATNGNSDDGFTEDDIRVKMYGRDEKYITLMPFFDEYTHAASFKHVTFPNMPDASDPINIDFDVMIPEISATNYKNSIKNNKDKIGHVADEGSREDKAGDDPDGASDAYYYGSIAVQAEGVLWPVYAWVGLDNSMCNTAVPFLDVPADASCLYYINDAAGSNGDFCGGADIPLMRDYNVDILSFYLFIAKIHSMYHDRYVWDRLGEDMGSMYDAIASRLSSTSGCKDPHCYLMNVLGVAADKGKRNNTYGFNDRFLPISSLYYPAGSLKGSGRGLPMCWHLGYLADRIMYTYKDNNAFERGTLEEYMSVLNSIPISYLSDTTLTKLTEATGEDLQDAKYFLYMINKITDPIEKPASLANCNDNVIKYVYRVMFANGFMNNQNNVFSGDSIYYDELINILTANNERYESDFFDQVKIVINSLDTIANDVSNYMTKQNEKAQSICDGNRMVGNGAMKVNKLTVPGMVELIVPTLFNQEMDKPIDVDNFAKDYDAMRTEISNFCANNKIPCNVGGTIAVGTLKNNLNAYVSELANNISTAPSENALIRVLYGDGLFDSSNWGKDGSTSKKFYNNYIKDIDKSTVLQVLLKSIQIGISRGNVKLDDATKLQFFHALTTAVYSSNGSLSGKTKYLDTLDFGFGSGISMIAQAQIDTYKSSWEIAKTNVKSTGLEGGPTLKIRSDIIDFYAKYSLPEDDLIKEVVGYTQDILDIHEQKNIPNNVYPYAPVDIVSTTPYFYYQMMLLQEATVYSTTIYANLIFSILNNGVTLENNGKCITTLSNVKYVFDKYRGPVTDQAWIETLGSDSSDYSLNTLAGLYDYLIKLGFISSAEYTIDIYDENDPLTLFWTQASGNVTFSQDYYTGRALSATYIPMQTNVYDPYAMLDYVDTNWIEDFHYKYGFYRKALLIDTNVDAAVDSYVSNTQGTTRVATLQDLLNCESDIVLYVDEHFYGLSELSDLQNKTYDRLASTNPNMFESIMNSISDMFSIFREVDFDVALKHSVPSYSLEIANNVSDMGLELSYNDDGSIANSLKKYDQYILMPSAIKEYISKDEYTPMTGYAIVSNIYRNKEAFNIINTITAKRTPVFESSPTLATVSGATAEAKSTIYNYALLKNLSAMSTVGYETSTDMSSPIYCDIYGNIVTESGLVVVPAACNATLHRVDPNPNNSWQPICTGFLSTYGKEWSIPTSWNLDEEFMSTMFYKNEELGVWEIRNKTIQNMEINFAQLSYADKAVNVALKEWYNYDLVNGSQINQYNSLNILHEVLRGAPLENIDFDAENLNSARKVDKSGLIAAAKLDNIVNSLDWDDENSIMSIPRLSFIDNYQYVVVFIFKVLLVIVVTALMITIYVDVLKTKISWRTLGRCIGTLVLGVACVLMIPISYDISYYQSNKLLLQDEAEYIMMLNTEKNMSGREIGVYEVTEPEQHTQILIKLEDFEFNWLEVLPSVITSDSINVMDAKYKEFLNNSLLANKDNVQAMNDGMYMDVQDIFDTSVLNFSTTSKQLYQKVSVDPVASYYIPYYYFLDALLTNMNDFNRSNNVYAYSTKIMRGGAVKTVNLCSAYFNSKEFMEGNDSDYLGLYQLYDTMGSMIILPIFNEESIEPARQSQWYVGTLMPEEDVLERIQLMDTKVKQFIMENKNLIGKVTDETFLKCMAMDLAIEYNNIFGIPSANAFEVYNLSNADLMRLTIADKASTLEGSPMSFSRFVYNEAGTPGVYASVFLVITTMFVQTMKTIITIAIMALLVISVFVFKILLRKSNNSIAGYLLTLLVICSTNILYAVILKVSLAIPQTGLAPTLCIIIQIIIQLAYLWVLTVVLGFALRDWKNIGFTKYQTIGHNLKEKFSRRHSRSPKDRYDSQPRGVDGWDYYRKLVKENEQRMKKVGTH